MLPNLTLLLDLLIHLSDEFVIDTIDRFSHVLPLSPFRFIVNNENIKNINNNIKKQMKKIENSIKKLSQRALNVERSVLVGPVCLFARLGFGSEKKRSRCSELLQADFDLHFTAC